MRNSILGFNQNKLIAIQTNDLKLDMNDILLMDYIQRALSQPSMCKKCDDANQPYVWLNHKKILEDLPILDIGESMLKKRIAKLVDLGLIKSMTFANENLRGSKSYYTITELFEDLQRSDDMTKDNILPVEDMTKDKKLPVKTRPSVKNYPSNNKLNSNIDNYNNIIINNNIKELENKPKKKSLYNKCIDSINDFMLANSISEDKRDSLFKALVDYLNLILEIKKDEGKVLYANMWKGMLNTLLDVANSTGSDYIDIVSYATKKGWKNFYPIPTNNFNNSYKPKDVADMTSARSEKLTGSDLEEWERRRDAGDVY